MGQVFFDRLTIVTAAEDVPFVAVRGAMVDAAATVTIAGAAGCPVGDACVVSALVSGSRVFDRTAAFDLATVRAATALPEPGPPSGLAALFHDASPLAKAFREADDARVVQVRAVTYYHDAARNQLRRATGPRADAPVLDDVVGFRSATLAIVRRRPRRVRPRGARTVFSTLPDSGARRVGAGRWRSGGVDGGVADRWSLVWRQHRRRRRRNGSSASAAV